MRKILTIKDYKPYTLKDITEIFVDLKYILDCSPELIESKNFSLKLTNVLESGRVSKNRFYININNYDLSIIVSDDHVNYRFETDDNIIYFKNIKDKDIITSFQTAVNNLIEAISAAHKYMFNKKLEELKINYQNE